jgi:hypothetical protein
VGNQSTEGAGAGKSSIAALTPCPTCGRSPLVVIPLARSPLQLLLGSLIAAYGPPIAAMVIRWTLDRLQEWLMTHDG